MDNFLRTLKKSWQAFLRWAKRTKNAFLKNFTKWIDPKLEPYRRKALVKAPETPPVPVPTTTAEFLDLLKRTPRSVINARERHVIASIMHFPTTKVSELMFPPSAITYVKDDEVLGPLTLDRLYRSGFQHFPVTDRHQQIIGLIHTTSLNSLEIKQTTTAREILDPKIYYLRDDYTLNQALAAFLRTNCYFFLVVDHVGRIVGMLTYQALMDFLLGETPQDSFDHDHDRLAVAKRS